MITRILKKYNELSLPIKATFWFTLCNFVLKGISFITVPLFTRFLSTEEYGKMSIYYSYEQIILIFATFELSLGAYMRGIIKYKKELKNYTSSLLLLSTIITVVVFLIFYPFRNVFEKLTGTSQVIFYLMFIFFILQPAYNCWLNRKRFEYSYKSAVIMTLLFTCFTTIIPLLSIIIFGKTANIKISTMLIIEILFCIPF